MTFFELFVLIKHYWKVIVGVPFACALVALALSFTAITPKYAATATLTSVDPSGNVLSDALMTTVTPIAGRVSVEASDSTIVTVKEPKAGGTAAEMRVLTFTATGSSPDKCVTKVNEAAHAVADEASEIFAVLEENQAVKREAALRALEGLDVGDPTAETLLETLIIDKEYSHCSFIVEEAVSANATGLSRGSMVLALTFLGFVAAVIGVTVAGLVKRPISGVECIESACEIPILAWPSGVSPASMLRCNLLGLKKNARGYVAIVPLSHIEGSSFAGDLEAISSTKGSGGADSIDTEEGAARFDEFVVCEPLNRSLVDAPCIKGASAVVVCATMWRDTLDVLGNSLRELELIGAKLEGIALISE